MKTWIFGSLVGLASLVSCIGPVSPAGAQTINAVTFRPAEVSRYLVGNPSFEVTYTVSPRVKYEVCSPEGRFVTEPGPAASINLGVYDRAAKININRRTLLEQVTIPSAVIDEVKRRRITKPVYYSREWVNCDSRNSVASTNVPVTLIPFSVEAVPGAARVGLGSDTVLPLRWRAIFGDGVSTRVESPEGRFVDGSGRVYGSTVRNLLQASGSSPLEFSETLQVPESVVRSVLAAPGSAGLRFERTFLVEGLQTTAAVQLLLASRIASPFGIERAELRFLDGSRFRTVPLGEAVEVEGVFSFSGSGRLQGAWELAGPTTTPGNAIFVRKQLVDEYLSFGRQTVIRSPAFAADQPGTYLVRLSITSPDLGEGGVLQLRYVVRATGGVAQVALGLPPALAPLAPGQPFTWAAVAGASHYLLEFYDVPVAEAREPAAGMVLPGSANRAVLSQSAERNFQPGKTYWWRVVALGPDGVLLGQSALRELLTPQEWGRR